MQIRKQIKEIIQAIYHSGFFQHNILKCIQYFIQQLQYNNILNF